MIRALTFTALLLPLTGFAYAQAPVGNGLILAEVSPSGQLVGLRWPGPGGPQQLLPDRPLTIRLRLADTPPDTATALAFAPSSELGRFAAGLPGGAVCEVAFAARPNAPVLEISLRFIGIQGPVEGELALGLNPRLTLPAHAAPLATAWPLPPAWRLRSGEDRAWWVCPAEQDDAQLYLALQSGEDLSAWSALGPGVWAVLGSDAPVSVAVVGAEEPRHRMRFRLRADEGRAQLRFLLALGGDAASAQAALDTALAGAPMSAASVPIAGSGMAERLSWALQPHTAVLAALHDTTSGSMTAGFRAERYGNLDWPRFGAWAIRAYARADRRPEARQIADFYLDAARRHGGGLPAALYADGTPALPEFVRDVGATAWTLAALDYCARVLPAEERAAWLVPRAAEIAGLVHHLSRWFNAADGAPPPYFSPWAGHDRAGLDHELELQLGLRAGLALMARLQQPVQPLWAARERDIASLVKLELLNRPPPWALDPVLVVWLRDYLPQQDPLWAGALATGETALPLSEVDAHTALALETPATGGALEAEVVRASLRALSEMDLVYGREPAGVALTAP